MRSGSGPGRAGVTPRRERVGRGGDRGEGGAVEAGEGPDAVGRGQAGPGSLRGGHVHGGAGPERRGGFWRGRGHPAADPRGAWVGSAHRGRARSRGDGSCGSEAGPGDRVGPWRRGRGRGCAAAPTGAGGAVGRGCGAGCGRMGHLVGAGRRGRGRLCSWAPIGRGALVPPVARRRARAPAPPPWGTCPRGVALAPRRPLGASGPRSRRERGRARRAR